MSALKDLKGKRFGMLLVVEYHSSNNGAKWLCRCDCGNVSVVPSRSLNYGTTRSCGCGSKKQAVENCNKHRERIAVGLPYTRQLKDVYRNMLSRCYDSTNRRYKNYGGRGIVVCNEWLDGRRAFYKWAIENGYRPGLMIDRRDNDGNYCPQNCRFVDAYVQMNNTSRNRFIEWNGAAMTVAQWERSLNWRKGRLQSRLNNGWSVDRAMTQEPRKSKWTA